MKHTQTVVTSSEIVAKLKPQANTKSGNEDLVTKLKSQTSANSGNETSVRVEEQQTSNKILLGALLKKPAGQTVISESAKPNNVKPTEMYVTDKYNRKNYTKLNNNQNAVQSRDAIGSQNVEENQITLEVNTITPDKVENVSRPEKVRSKFNK